MPGYREAVRACLAAGRTPRGVYEALGEQSLLAADWPPEFGGGGHPPEAASVLREELIEAGVPDGPLVSTIATAGAIILRTGDAGQLASYLPELARGRSRACLVAPLSARRTGTGWVLDGDGRTSPVDGPVEVLVCAADTPDGLSLFVIDAATAGVRLTCRPGEPVARVEFTGVRTGPRALLGVAGAGAEPLGQVLTTPGAAGVHWQRMSRWLRTVQDGVPEPDDLFHVDLARHCALVDAGRHLDREPSAAGTLHGLETARAVTEWAVRVHGFGYVRGRLDPPGSQVLDAAYRHFTSFAPLPAAVQAIEEELAADPDPVAVPPPAGGTGPGLRADVEYAEQVGRAGTASSHVAGAMAIDAAATGEAEILPTLEAGNIAVLAAGFESVTFGTAPRLAAAQDHVDGRLVVEPGDVDAVLLPVHLDGSDDVGLVLIDWDRLVWTEQPAGPGTTGVAEFSVSLCDPSPLLCRLAPETGCAEGPLGRARIRQAAYLCGLGSAMVAAFSRTTPQACAWELARGRATLAAVRAAVRRTAALADAGQPYAGAATEVLALAAEAALATDALVLRAYRTSPALQALRLRIRLEAFRFGRPEELWLAAGRRRMSEEGRKRT